MILWLETAEPSVWQVGGKGAGLVRLARQGFPVPPGFIVPAEVYRRCVRSHGVTEALINELEVAAEPTVPITSQRLREAIRHLVLPDEVAAAIIGAYHRLCPHTEPVAVRSSATAEDTETASFAGQQETYLGVQGDDEVVQRVRDCWASLYTDRAVSYRRANGVDERSVDMAVVVQKMVDAEKSGVLFTANPVTGSRSELCIEACWGLGEALVSGMVTPDHYVVGKATGEVITQQVAAKRTMMVRVGAGERVRATSVPPERVYEPVLRQEELRRLIELGKAVEAQMGTPQDIEWAIERGEVYLLQSRPITALGP